MAHSKPQDACGQVRVFFDGLPANIGGGELSPTLRLSYDDTSQALTFVVGLGGDRAMSVQEVEVRSLIEVMVSKSLVRTTHSGHYVVRLPNGSSYRAPPAVEIDLTLTRATLHVGDGYDDVSFPFIAPVHVVRVNGRCRTPLLGLRFGTRAVKLMLDIDVRSFCLALLHLGALDPMGAPPTGTGRSVGSYRFQVGLPARPLAGSRHGSGDAA